MAAVGSYRLLSLSLVFFFFFVTSTGMESSLLGGQIREFEQALRVKPVPLKEVLPVPTALPDHTQSTA